MSRALEAGGLYQQDFSRIESEFPEHRVWNQPLGHALVHPPRPSGFRRVTEEEDFWGGRLKAVFPGFDVPDSETTNYDTAALRRLFEDVALANADAGIPNVALASR